MSRIWVPEIYAGEIAGEIGMPNMGWEGFEYSDELLTKSLYKRGSLSPIYKASRAEGSNIVVGKVKLWDEVQDPRQIYAFIGEGPLHVDGVYITRYPKVHVKYHKGKGHNGTKTIDEKTGSDRFDIMSHPHFVGQIFLTYYFYMRGRKKTGYKPMLVLVDENDILESHPFAAMDGQTPNVLDISKRNGNGSLSNYGIL